MKRDMNYNFSRLREAVDYSLTHSDIDQINELLSSIDGETLTSGVGGSSVVSLFASKVLGKKNKIISENHEDRDLLYIDLDHFKNVVCCSYSGNNYGVEISFLNNLKHYLLSSRENKKEGICNITYKDLGEDSFISLAATIVPCSILLNYYLDGKKDSIVSSITPEEFQFKEADVYEIFSGVDTSVAATYLDSTMTEAGIGIPVIHDKYQYCHGRSTLSTKHPSIAIYFNKNTELDKLLISLLKEHYKDVVIIDYEEGIKGEFELLVKCMYLTKFIAGRMGCDLSRVEYSPMVKKLYHYTGKM